MWSPLGDCLDSDVSKLCALMKAYAEKLCMQWRSCIVGKYVCSYKYRNSRFTRIHVFSHMYHREMADWLDKIIVGKCFELICIRFGKKLLYRIFHILVEGNSLRKYVSL